MCDDVIWNRSGSVKLTTNDAKYNLLTTKLSVCVGLSPFFFVFIFYLCDYIFLSPFFFLLSIYSLFVFVYFFSVCLFGNMFLSLSLFDSPPTHTHTLYLSLSLSLSLSHSLSLFLSLPLSLHTHTHTHTHTQRI